MSLAGYPSNNLPKRGRRLRVIPFVRSDVYGVRDDTLQRGVRTIRALGAVDAGVSLSNEDIVEGIGRDETLEGDGLFARFASGAEPRSARSRSLSPESLFAARQGSMVKALTLLSGDAGLAEDSVQEAFVRLCVNWKRVSRYEDPAAWVYRVALNLTRDHRRRLVRRARLLLRLSASVEPARQPTYTDPLLWAAVRELPTQQRTAVALRYLGDLGVVEVARAMKISEGTVKRHLGRARETLRAKLEEQS